MNRTQLSSLGVALIVLGFLALSLSACSKNSSSPTGPGGAGGVVTVSGKVIGSNGQPVAGVAVLVTGLPSVNTDANGAFTISGVSTPYSIAVVNGTNSTALVYRGLTRSDPTLYWPGITTGTAHSASASGTLVPWTAIPPGTQTTAAVSFVSTEASGSTAPNLSTGAYTVNVGPWYGASTTITGTLYALVWNYDASNLPTAFTKFGKRSNVSLLDGTTNPNQNDTLGTAQTGQITGTITLASGYTFNGRYLFAVFESKGGIPVLYDNSTVPNFTYNTPNVSGASMSLQVAATKATGGTVESYTSGLAVNATNVAVTVPAAPELSLPVDNATGITTSSPFSWTPFTGGVQVLEFTPNVGGQPRFWVVTAASSDSIPNLASAGLPIPKAATYKWALEAVAPFSSVDAATGTGGLAQFVLNPHVFTGAYGRTNQRTFTTAP
jgi:hypothetical protein